MADVGESAGEVVSAAIDSDSELNAIRDVLSALVPLKREGRTRVLDYVLKRLGMQGDQVTQVPAIGHSGSAIVPGLPTQKASDIRSLTSEKAPRSANEMAALVAYYLSEAAPEGERKDKLNTEDIKKYFKQANFKLPSRPEMALVNAKNAGYFESVGGGHYQLNPVGYNLVVHNLPAGTAGTKQAKAKKQIKRHLPRTRR
jgi:hypothetical protein